MAGFSFIAVCELSFHLIGPHSESLTQAPDNHHTLLALIFHCRKDREIYPGDLCAIGATKDHVLSAQS